MPLSIAAQSVRPSPSSRGSALSSTSLPTPFSSAGHREERGVDGVGVGAVAEGGAVPLGEVLGVHALPVALRGLLLAVGL